MTGTEIAMIIGQIAVLITSIGGFIVMTRRQDKSDIKVDELHKSTNSLAERAEAMAKKLGVTEGHTAGLREGREEGR